MAVVFITVGPPGTGKSFERGSRWLAEEFLPYNKGKHYSNLPVKPAAMADYVKRKHGVDIGDRIQRIPQDVLDSWAKFESGPWDYFTDERFGAGGLEGAHIAIDECHYYFPFGTQCPKEHRRKLQNWLGTIRHVGVTVEFMTQAHGKVAKEITDHCENRITLCSAAEYSLPLIGIRYGDLYQVIARFTGRLIRVSHVTEEQLKGRRWETVRGRLIPLREPYFSLYDSYNATEDGQAGAQPKLEWERLEGLRFWRWLWGRYWLTALSRVGFLLCIAFFLWGFGSGFFMRRYLAAFTANDPVAEVTEDGFTVEDLQRSEAPQPALATPVTPATLALAEARQQQERERQAEALSVTAIGERSATVGGWSILVGESVDPSDDQSAKVIATDPVRGRVSLSDGRRVAIGGRLLQAAEEEAPEARPVADIGGTILQHFRRGGSGAASAARVDQSGRDAAGGAGDAGQ